MSGEANNNNIFIASADPAIADVSLLIAELDTYLQAIYPAESNHLDAVDTLKQPNVTFLTVKLRHELAGCGAIKYMQDDGYYGEIKRVYVRPIARGHGLSLRLMSALEHDARENQCQTIRLEAGSRQPEALGLYGKLGYVERGPFGCYNPDPFSVFMEKNLTPATI